MLDGHQRMIQGFVVVILTYLAWTIQDVTLYVNSKYLPMMAPLPPNPYPFATSLYRAPQTYDRGKTMPTVPRKPYILISKVRPCFGNAGNAGRHFDRLHQRPNNEVANVNSANNYYSPLPMVKFTGTHVQHHHHHHHQMQPFQQINSDPHVTEEFSGSWAITKPDNGQDHNQNDNLDGNGVTYNDDGTRILVESMNKYVPENQQFHGQTSMLEEDDGGSDDTEPTTYITAVTSDYYSSSPPPQEVNAEVTTPSPLTTTTTLEDFPSTFGTMTVPIEVSTVATTAMEIVTTHTNDDEEFDKVLPELTETTPATHRQSLTSTIMDKLEGGAKNMLVHFLGGILNGNQAQNQKDKTEKQLSEKELTERLVENESPSSSISPNGMRVTAGPNSPALDTFPSYFQHPPDSYSTARPSGHTDHDYDITIEGNSQDVEIDPDVKPTVTTTAVLTSDEHPLIAMATSVSPQQFMNNSSCKDCEQIRKEEERGSTSGWRPLQWPAFWLTKLPSHQRPPSPPSTLLNYVHTSWNDTLVHDKRPQVRNHSSFIQRNNSTSYTESELLSSFDISFQHPTSIPRLPSHLLEEDQRATPFTNMSEGSPILLVDWLLGGPTSQNNNSENINQTQFDRDANRTETTNKTIDKQQESYVAKPNGSDAHRPLVRDPEWTGRKTNPNSEDIHLETKDNKKNNHKEEEEKEMIDVESAIREMKKLYEKFRLGIPTPLHIFQHLKTLHPALQQIKTLMQ